MNRTEYKVEYKQNISQNMPIWEHKRSNSVILSYTPYEHITLEALE